MLFENSADVTYAPSDKAVWPGDGEIPSESPGDVGLDWYLSFAEQVGLRGAIPTPVAGGRWEDKANRLARIDELVKNVADATVPRVRTYYLKQLEKARNYERLIELSLWWGEPGPLT